uniref:PNPLA domain-containing protein n=1 Tax=viral metagenome TaxID=1070528 RepID=A0A6C0BT47_9ZZZZ
MNIEHIVFSGGGPVGLSQTSSINYLLKENYIDINNIKTVYGVSIGYINALCVALKYDFKDIMNYIIYRPWEKIFNIKPSTAIYNIITKKGIFGTELWEKSLSPLLLAKNFTTDVTLRELFEKTNIELHGITTDINEFKTVDFSYKTHPDLKIVDAVHMTCALPLLFTPPYIDNTLYLDGGTTNNFPLDLCIKNSNIENTDTILAFKNLHKPTFITKLDDTSDISEIFSTLIKKLTRKIHDNNDNNIKHIINLYTQGIDVYSMTSLLDKNNRKLLLDKGEEYTRLFLEYHSILNN